MTFKLSELKLGEGAATGLIVGLLNYWNHFKSEVFLQVVDGIVMTTVTTLVGASVAFFVTWALKKLIKK